MKRISRQPTAFSKVSVRNQTVIPHEIREQLKLKRGVTLRYRVTDDGALLDKATETGDGPFAAFSEWTSEADEGPWRIIAESFSVRHDGRACGALPQGDARPIPPTARTRR
jgi:antitoxin PrlF